MKIEVILTPAELPALAKHDLRETGCVVFDVLRAPSTIVTALHNGAKEIIPVSEIAEALALKRKQPDVLLGGERDGVRIRAAQTGGIDFDLGNSPREYTTEKVRRKTIVSTTTNGTRALRACAGAKTILAASFLNLGATARFLQQAKAENVLLICAGTQENAALEDILAAGALCEILNRSSRREEAPSEMREMKFEPPDAGCYEVRGEGFLRMTDSAQIAFRAWTQAKSDLAAAIRNSENARRLLGIPALRDDVPFCLQRDTHPLAARMEADGAIRRA
jgi:2-phosphosulfolactate phosphatase